MAAAAKPRPAPAPPAAPSAPLIDEAEVIDDLVHIETFDQSAAIPAPATPVPGAIAPAMPEAMSFDLSESPLSAAEVAEDPMASVWAADAPAAPVAQQASATDEGADDLNTNTLAELYISQGFYDKALEIYQGMLNDKPGNKALQQKIGQLKEMAGEQEASSALRATPVAAGAREYTPPAEAVGEAAVTPPEAATPAPAKRTAPAPAAPQEAAEHKQAAPQPPASAPVAPGAHAASARRQATIDRLESWLKNVAKEKQ
jgi:hypothetical protein